MSTTSSSRALNCRRVMEASATRACGVASMAVTKPDGSVKLYLSLPWVPVQRRRARRAIRASIKDHVRLASADGRRVRVFVECPGHPWAWRRKRKEI